MFEPVQNLSEKKPNSICHDHVKAHSTALPYSRPPAMDRYRIGRTVVAIWRDAIERPGPFRTLANVGLQIMNRSRARETSSFTYGG